MMAGQLNVNLKTQLDFKIGRQQSLMKYSPNASKRSRFCIESLSLMKNLYILRIPSTSDRMVRPGTIQKQRSSKIVSCYVYSGFSVRFGTSCKNLIKLLSLQRYLADLKNNVTQNRPEYQRR